jgi:predicted kinase
MSQQKFIIALIGTSCSGKSTTRKAVEGRIPTTYLISYDKQKWLLSGYDRTVHAPLIKDITFGLFKTVCEKGISVFLEYISKEEEYKKCKEIADQYGYTFICIELKASQDILLKRFQERVKEVKEKGQRISVMDTETFLSNLLKGYYVPEGTYTFDTEISSPEEISSEILKILNSVQ